MSATSTITCSSCHGQTPAGKRFCIHCGAAVPQGCPTCGEAIIPGARFCAECGTPLGNGQPVTSMAAAPPVSERRLVSVLFADLVGFTTLSEHRDPEEVRGWLSLYFERCRSLIE